MSDRALPPHLRGRLHGDWIWPLNKISRGWNAYGPRVSRSAPDFLPWPPRLVAGKSVCRWETAGGNSIILIAGLDNVEVTYDDVYGRRWLATEMNPGHPNFMKSEDIFLPHWEESLVWDEEPINGPAKQMIKGDFYSPSALQKFSKRGWMSLYPFYHTEWNVLKKRELPVWPETGEDTVIFWRRGYRPDHVDLYYNKSIIGTAGLHWE